MHAPLPSFFRPPSTERDQTIMRPANDDFCLQVPNSSDYLIPLPGPRSAAERLMSEATGVTMSSTVTTCAMPRVTSPAAPNSLNDSGCWETSFMLPNSKSDQQLLSSEHTNHIDDTKLISLDTPQQTPTLIKPPISFGDKDSNSITLDPANLSNNQGMSYANVHMINPAKIPPPPEHQPQISQPEKVNVNGTVIIEKSAPFTIQGFNDRYKSNENHSEINC